MKRWFWFSVLVGVGVFVYVAKTHRVERLAKEQAAANTRRDPQLRLGVPPARGMLHAPEAPNSFEWSGLSVEREAVAAVSETGGRVDLPDGTAVVLPAGAVSGDHELSVRRLRLPGPEGPTQTVTQILLDGKDAELAAEAEVTLPCPPLSDAQRKQSPQYGLDHYHGSRKETVPCTYDPTRHVVKAGTRRFSVLVLGAVFLGAVWWYAGPTGEGVISASAEEVLQRAARRKGQAPLEVPYYSQGNAQWCWAACIEMLMKAHGKDVEIWKIGERAGTTSTEGLRPLSGNMLGLARTYFSEVGLKTEGNTLPWRNHAAMLMHIMDEIDRGAPVWVGMNAIEHAVVIVGYDDAGVFLHDPSGFLVERIQLSPADQKEVFEQCRLGAVHMPYHRFLGLKRNPVSVENSDWAFTLSVTNTFAAAHALTVALLPHQLKFLHPAPAGLGQPDFFAIDLHWNGQRTGGVEFLPSADSPYSAAESCPRNASRSDRMDLRVHVSNGSPRSYEGVVRAMLGDPAIVGPVSEKKFGFAAMPRPPYDANTLIELFHDEPLSSLPVGRHALTIELQTGTTIVDTCTLEIAVGPSQVKNLKGEEHGSGEYVRLTWDPVPDADCMYDVYRFEVKSGAPQRVSSTRETDCKDVSADHLKDPTFYFVCARHVPSGLSGPPSGFYRPTVGQTWKLAEVKVDPEGLLTKLNRVHAVSSDVVKVTQDRAERSFQVTPTGVPLLGRNASLSLTARWTMPPDAISFGEKVDVEFVAELSGDMGREGAEPLGITFGQTCQVSPALRWEGSGCLIDLGNARYRKEVQVKPGKGQVWVVDPGAQEFFIQIVLGSNVCPMAPVPAVRYVYRKEG